LIYPKVDVVDNVLFIGLDSNAEELHWYDRMLAEGELGELQLERLQQIIDDPAYNDMQKVVYLHHHPFDKLVGHQLKDSDELRKVIEYKVDALLFGHLHKDSENAGQEFNGTWGIKRAYNAGSSTHKNGNAGCHRVIDLSLDPINDKDAKLI
jgi:3',5'-cyclic AMP phosphodiesterase CpdA